MVGGTSTGCLKKTYEVFYYFEINTQQIPLEVKFCFVVHSLQSELYITHAQLTLDHGWLLLKLDFVTLKEKNTVTIQLTLAVLQAYNYWVMANIIYPYLRGSPSAYSDLYVSSSILPGSNLLWGFFLGFFLYLGINLFPPPPLRLWTCQLTWSVTLLTCIQTCNITIVIYVYARSFTNHITWHKNQWFITMATYWSHCDVIEMHVRFVLPLSISFGKNSTQITSDLCSQVNITKYCFIYWQFAPEEITAVIEMRRTRLWLICFLSFCIYRHI